MHSVRVAGDAGCERIYKEKKMQKVKFYFYFSKRGKSLVARNAPALMVVAMSFYWIKRDRGGFSWVSSPVVVNHEVSG